MLKKIPAIISPDLIKILMEMGHGDEIVLADGNFPAARYAQRIVRYDGNNAIELLEAILEIFPLDFESDCCVSLMDTGDEANKPEIWEQYRNAIVKHESNFSGFHLMERYDFYDRSKNAFAIIATGERALYANIIIKKGVVI